MYFLKQFIRALFFFCKTRPRFNKLSTSLNCVDYVSVVVSGQRPGNPKYFGLAITVPLLDTRQYHPLKMGRAGQTPADHGNKNEKEIDKSSADGNRNVLRSSATGTTFLIMIQLASRIFTFASNQLILRTLSPVVLGIAAQLELFQVTILYFSRESIRMAIQRQPLDSSPSSSTNDKDRDTEDTENEKQSLASQSVVNVSYLSLLLGVIFTSGLTWFYKHFAPEQAHTTPFFNHSVTVTGLASLMELTIEPFFAVIQQRMWYEKRAAVELPAAFLKSLVTCTTFFYASRQGHDVGALPFALGYLAYSIALIFGYYWSLLWTPFTRRFSFLLSQIGSRYLSHPGELSSLQH